MTTELVAPEGKCEICGHFSSKREILDTEYMSPQEVQVIYNAIEKRFGKNEKTLGKIFFVCPECYAIVMEEYNQRFNGR